MSIFLQEYQFYISLKLFFAFGLMAKWNNSKAKTYSKNKSRSNQIMILIINLWLQNCNKKKLYLDKAFNLISYKLILHQGSYTLVLICNISFQRNKLLVLKFEMNMDM